MTASEKLAALDGLLGAGWEKPDLWCYYMSPEEEDFVEAFRNALPQIVAVVSENESFMEWCEAEAGGYWPPTNARDDDVARLYRALAALEETLT